MVLVKFFCLSSFGIECSRALFALGRLRIKFCYCIQLITSIIAYSLLQEVIELLISS